MKTLLRSFAVIIVLCFGYLCAYAQTPTAKVDTFCTIWHVCIHDRVGIKSIELLDDPNGILATPARQYKNVYLDPKLDPLNTRKINLSGADSVVCFDVFVGNPLDTAYAPVFITDVNNAHLVVDLYYLKLPPLRVANENLPTVSIDSIKYPLVKVGQETCSTIVYINTAQKGGNPISINSVKLKKDDGSFKIASIAPSLPIYLTPGDTLKVQICFNPRDTFDFNDSLILRTTCFDAPLPLTGSAGTPLIYATDIDFGDVVVGSTSCKELTISNKGKLPFILTRNWLLHNSNVFEMDPTYAGYLPFSILPGKSFKIIICYSPKSLGGDSTTIDWNTDIEGKFANQIKSWSFLKGNSISEKTDVKHSKQTAIFSIRPNPATGRSVMVSFAAKQSKSTLAIYDILGREVYKEDVNPGAIQTELPIGNLIPGTYYLRFNSELKVFTQKLEIIR